MKVNISNKFLQFFYAIDKILWEDWDPIGVMGCSEARDEYLVIFMGLIL